MVVHEVSRELGGEWPIVTRLKPWRLASAVVPDGTRLISIGTGVCRPPGGMKMYLGAWGGNVFQNAAWRGICASLSLEDEATCLSRALHHMTLSRYEVFV